MFGPLKNEKTCFFALGAAAATIGVKFLKSKTFHDGCVKTVAKGMKIKDEASAELVKIKEDAEDIRFEEKAQDQQ
ncbi:MAG: DUF1490 domain-containing protein [Ruminococcus sp.]|nr:DUF1490 domain-containing protein [Ruminococcus sp.]